MEFQYGKWVGYPKWLTHSIPKSNTNELTKANLSMGVIDSFNTYISQKLQVQFICRSC
jgi:hypothetical protein